MHRGDPIEHLIESRTGAVLAEILDDFVEVRIEGPIPPSSRWNSSSMSCQPLMQSMT
jgi:hypothetical protein